MQSSPYTPGTVAREVPGRDHEIAHYEQLLTLMADTQMLIGRPRVECGPRGYGKTSLLRQVQERAERRGIITVWVTAGEQAGVVEQIAVGIRKATKGWAKDSATAIGRLVDSVTVGLRVPGVAHVDATLKAPDTTSTARDLQALITSTALHAARSGRGGLVIFIDEIQAIDPAGFRALAYAWQHMQSEDSSAPAALFAAGLSDTADVLTRVVTSSERYDYHELPSLTDAAERIALVQPARAKDVAWDEEALTLARDIADGYPYFVQLIGDGAWQSAGNPDPGTTIDVAAVVSGRAIMDANVRAMFRGRWSSATPREQDFIQAMAEIMAERPGPVRRGDVGQRMSAKMPGDISVARQRLLDKGLIRVAGHGLLEFTAPGFAEYVYDLTDVGDIHARVVRGDRS